MIAFATLAEKQAYIEAQKKDLDFDWFSHRPADLEKRYAVADTIYQLVSDEVMTENPIPSIFDVQRGEMGKVIKAKRHYGGKVYERSYGEFKKISHFKAKFYTMTTSPKTMHISVPVDELQAGIITIPELAREAAYSILHYKVKVAWDCLVDATQDAANWTNVGTTLTQTALDGALRTMRDKYELSAIIGRFSLVSLVTTYTGFDYGTGYADAQKAEIYNTGMLGKYMGVPIMPMKEFTDELYDTVAIDAKNAFIVGQVKSWNRYVEVKSLTQSNETVPSDGTFHMYFDWEDGCSVWESKYLHRLWNGVS